MSKSNLAIVHPPEEKPTTLFALDKPRIVRLTIAGAAIDFLFEGITSADWRKCLEAVVTRVEQHGTDRVRINDEAASLVQLFKRVVKVTGYKGSAGLTDAQACARVPMRHRVAATQALRTVYTSSAVGDLSLSEFAEVEIEALYTANADGTMDALTGLVHRFCQPTIEQYTKWRMGVARVIVSGTAEEGVTVYPSRLAVALGLYDEMIAEVDGYSVNGKALTNEVDLIIAHMDGMHKARAVVELFERDEEDITIGGPAVSGTDAAAE